MLFILLFGIIVIMAQSIRPIGSIGTQSSGSSPEDYSSQPTSGLGSGNEKPYESPLASLANVMSRTPQNLQQASGVSANDSDATTAQKTVYTPSTKISSIYNNIANVAAPVQTDFKTDLLSSSNKYDITGMTPEAINALLVKHRTGNQQETIYDQNGNPINYQDITTINPITGASEINNTADYNSREFNQQYAALYGGGLYKDIDSKYHFVNSDIQLKQLQDADNAKHQQMEDGPNQLIVTDQFGKEHSIGNIQLEDQAYAGYESAYSDASGKTQSQYNPSEILKSYAMGGSASGSEAWNSAMDNASYYQTYAALRESGMSADEIKSMSWNDFNSAKSNISAQLQKNTAQALIDSKRSIIDTIMDSIITNDELRDKIVNNWNSIFGVAQNVLDNTPINDGEASGKTAFDNIKFSGTGPTIKVTPGNVGIKSGDQYNIYDENGKVAGYQVAHRTQKITPVPSQWGEYVQYRKQGT